jgi:hypothetical protein
LSCNIENLQIIRQEFLDESEMIAVDAEMAEEPEQCLESSDIYFAGTF